MTLPKHLLDAAEAWAYDNNNVDIDIGRCEIAINAWEACFTHLQKLAEGEFDVKPIKDEASLFFESPSIGRAAFCHGARHQHTLDQAALMAASEEIAQLKNKVTAAEVKAQVIEVTEYEKYLSDLKEAREEIERLKSEDHRCWLLNLKAANESLNSENKNLFRQLEAERALKEKYEKALREISLRGAIGYHRDSAKDLIATNIKAAHQLLEGEEG